MKPKSFVVIFVHSWLHIQTCTLVTYLGGGKFRGSILQKTAYTHLEEVEKFGEVQMVLRVCCKRQLSKGSPFSIVFSGEPKRVKQRLEF